MESGSSLSFTSIWTTFSRIRSDGRSLEDGDEPASPAGLHSHRSLREPGLRARISAALRTRRWRRAFRSAQTCIAHLFRATRAGVQRHDRRRCGRQECRSRCGHDSRNRDGCSSQTAPARPVSCDLACSLGRHPPDGGQLQLHGEAVIALLAAARATQFASLMAIFGAGAFAWLFRKKAIPEPPGRALLILFATCATLAIASAFLWFGLVVGQMSGDWGASLDPSVLTLAATSTRFGQIFLLRLIGLLALWLMSVTRPRGVGVPLVAAMLLALL